MQKISFEELKPGYILCSNDRFENADIYIVNSLPDFDHVQSTNSAWNRRHGTDQHDGRQKEWFVYAAYCGGKFSSKRSKESFECYYLKRAFDSQEILSLENN